MQFALGDHYTLGGTSAGKALHLADRGIEVALHALIGDDEDGRRVATALAAANVRLEAYAVGAHRTAREPDDAGGGAREPLPLDSVVAGGADLDRMQAALSEADVAVIDLSEAGAALVERQLAGAPGAPIWTDLHDYDGTSTFHEPFLRAADVVFMNDDATDDPWALMQSCLDRGPRIAVCTLGARGAIALAATGERAGSFRRSGRCHRHQRGGRRVLRGVPHRLARR